MALNRPFPLDDALPTGCGPAVVVVALISTMVAAAFITAGLTMLGWL